MTKCMRSSRGIYRNSTESLRAQGLPDQAALSQTWERIGNWDKLQRQIQMAREKENTMTPRTSQLWLPSWATLQVLMMMLPFVGALGAHLSSRAGGSRPAIIVSGIFPTLAFFVVLLLVLPFMGFLEHGLEVNARSLFHSWTCEPFGRLGVVASWVRRTCLFIGVAAYFLLHRQLAARSVASR